ncbi:transcriptional regulator [Sphingomonas sp. 3-13AW]|uniref:transcriptional regulator n=1 Tax=Sphingomonas sp. 3-13AW TaxID=3050450 RepID=UPI003BB71BBB
MDVESSPDQALQEAVTQAGSQAAFASICGVRQPAVSKWLRSGKPLPAEHVLTVERETGVSKHLLRPDLYPRPTASMSKDLPNTAIAVASNSAALFDRSPA